MHVNLKTFSAPLRDWWPMGLLLALWLLTWAVVNNALLIPSPWSVLVALGNYLFDPRFHISITGTMTTLFTAWALVQILLLFTLAAQFNPVLNQIFDRWSILFQTLPTFALLPVMIVLLGFGTPLLYAMVIFTNYWVGVNYLLTATRQSRARWHEQCENLGWHMGHQISRVYVYSLLPYLVNIGSITWGLCWRTLLALEVMFGGLGQQLGLGVLMQEDRMTYAIAEIWAILIVIMSVSVAVNSLFLWVKRRVHWT